MFCPGCPGDELTPLPRHGRVCSHGAAGDGSGRGGLRAAGGQGTGHPMARGEGSAAQGHSSSPISSPGLVSVRMRAATEELPARPRPEAALGGRRDAPVAGAEGTPRVTALPSPPRPAPHPSGLTRAPQGYFQLHPCHRRLLLIPSRFFPPKAASVFQGCSCSRWFGMLQALPLRLLPFPSGLALGSGKTRGWVGGVWWRTGCRGGVCWLSPLSPCAVSSGRVRACSRPAPAVITPPCSAQLLPSRGPRAAAARDAGAVLASADIPCFSSQPLTPRQGAALCPLPHGNAHFWGEGLALAGGEGISIFRLSQLFPFPSSFAHPEGLSLGCSLPSQGDFNQGHGSPLGLLPPAWGPSPSCSPLPGCLQLPTQAPLLWKRCFGAAGCMNANTARATAGKLEASQECFQVHVFLPCRGSAQSSHQECLHEHWDAADQIPGFSFLLFSPNIKLSC